MTNKNTHSGTIVPVERKILVVEDNPDFQEAFRYVLKKRNYTPRIVDSCEGAMKYVDGNGHDLYGIISDWHFNYRLGRDLREGAAVDFLGYLFLHNHEIPIVLTSDNRRCKELADSLELTYVSRDVGFDGIVDVLEKEVLSGRKLRFNQK